MCQPVQLMFLELVAVDGGLVVGGGVLLGGGAVVPGAPAVLVGWPAVGCAVVPGAEVAGVWVELPGVLPAVGPLELGTPCRAAGLLTGPEDRLLPAEGIGPPAF